MNTFTVSIAKETVKVLAIGVQTHEFGLHREWFIRLLA